MYRTARTVSTHPRREDSRRFSLPGRLDALMPRRAFSLIELLMVIAIIGLLVSILLPALAAARKAGRCAVCQSNLRQSAIARTLYGGDHKEVISTYSWSLDYAMSQVYPEGGYRIVRHPGEVPGGDPVAHMNQAVFIARRLTGRTDEFYEFFGPANSGPGYYLMVDAQLSSLPLIDGGYFSQRILEPSLVCAEDRRLLRWRNHVNDIDSFMTAEQDPLPASPRGWKRLMPFWSTYQPVPFAWAGEEPTPNFGPQIAPAVDGGGRHDHYTLRKGVTWQPRFHHEIFAPAQKVWQFDAFDRHTSKRDLWHAYAQARQPLLFFDGSVSMRTTKDANGGPKDKDAVKYKYWPTSADPSTVSGKANDDVYGYFRWTRNGLRGVDFGGL